MKLLGKLAKLTSAGPGSRTPAPPVEAPVEAPSHESVAHTATELPSDPADAARTQKIAELRGRIQALSARPSKTPAGPTRDEIRAATLPFTREESTQGVIHSRTRLYEVSQRHGTVPLHSALDAHGESISTVALDPTLRGFDPTRALYLDTETTGLAGGTGTLAFLVGIAGFEGRRFRVDQFFLAEPCDERAMLERLAERIEAAGSLVTYNGKAFDMPLLRSRFVLSRMKPPREPPHVDLVHIARRIYGERVEQCRLTTLERSVLGFARVDDVPSGEIPARYVHYLRTGDAEPLVGVIEHNLWDVIAMAALVGEIAARVSGGDASGRFEPADMAGLARTALRAGARSLATSLAETAASAGARLGQPRFAARTSAFAANIHKRSGNHTATHRLLLDALSHAPDEPGVHLALSKLYEHKLRDPHRALDHARLASGLEPAAAEAKRLRRLLTRIGKLPLLLPGLHGARGNSRDDVAHSSNHG